VAEEDLRRLLCDKRTRHRRKGTSPPRRTSPIWWDPRAGAVTAPRREEGDRHRTADGGQRPPQVDQETTGSTSISWTGRCRVRAGCNRVASLNERAWTSGVCSARHAPSCRPARAQAGVTRRVPWSERRIGGPRSGRPSEYALPRHAQCGEPCPSARESALVPSARSLPACPSTSGRGPSASTAGRRVMAHARAHPARAELAHLRHQRLPEFFQGLVVERRLDRRDQIVALLENRNWHGEPRSSRMLKNQTLDAGSA